jgi:hypothetical protein
MNRNTRRSESTFVDRLNFQAREMIGFLELGMKNDALKIAEQILSSKPFGKNEFIAALETILHFGHSENCHEHKDFVTVGFSKLSKTDQKDTSATVFQFYYHIDEVETAANYIPRHYVSSGVLRASMFALLELNQLKQARRILRIARQQLKEACDAEERSTLFGMFAEYNSFVKH